MFSDPVAGFRTRSKIGLTRTSRNASRNPTAANSNTPGSNCSQNGQHVAQEAGQLPHGAPARSRPQSLAAGEMDMKCKDLFYLSRASSESRFSLEALRDHTRADPSTISLRRGLNRSRSIADRWPLTTDLQTSEPPDARGSWWPLRES